MTDTFPAFLAIETGDDALPVAIAWSLPDGQIKYTLIQPLESWDDGDDLALNGYDLDTLHANGERPLDVIRELEADHFEAVLYVSGVGEEHDALERLFSEYGINPFVTLEYASRLYDNVDTETWQDARNDYLIDEGLPPMQADNEVLAMLNLHQRYNNER